ncbi:MAG: acyl-phosphate glycerol 3-phosphate acyltransferase [Deltaproteobacteria bacterium]|nr:MAG: acyl-phosphate glycerol 3-phosphate acyltransferase [Deltaproteobacteria bacterium]
MIIFFVLPVFAYLLGSMPWGIILTRLFTSIDIRHKGSGNIGATNVFRIAGPTLGVLTLVGDMLKGAIPVWLALVLAATNGVWGEIYISLVALSAFSGHLYPVYMKFEKGGKGVATAAGCFAVISPMAFVVLILVFIMSLCCLNRVAVASLLTATVLPVTVWKTTGSEILTGCAVVTAILIYFRHIDNIKRLLNGTEPVIWK